MSPDAARREKRFSTLNIPLLAVFLLISALSALLALRRGDGYAASQAALAVVMFTFPALIQRLFRFPIPQDCRLIYYVFVFGTVVVGSSFYGYSRIPYWDKIFHFFSGVLICAAGLMVCHLLFWRLDGPLRARRTLYVLFPFLFNLSVAAVWEFYEYALFVFFGVDAVNTLTTGVNDTMQDMLVCFLGGLVFSAILLAGWKRGRRGFLLRVCAHFFAVRGRELEL